LAEVKPNSDRFFKWKTSEEVFVEMSAVVERTQHGKCLFNDAT